MTAKNNLNDTIPNRSKRGIS